MVRAGYVAGLLVAFIIQGCWPGSVEGQELLILQESRSVEEAADPRLLSLVDEWSALRRSVRTESTATPPRETPPSLRSSGSLVTSKISADIRVDNPHIPEVDSPGLRRDQTITTQERIQLSTRLEGTAKGRQINIRTTTSSALEPDIFQPRSTCDCSAFSLLGLATGGAALAALGAALVQRLASGGSGRSQQSLPLADLLPDRLKMTLRDALVGPDHLLSITCRAASRLVSNGQLREEQEGEQRPQAQRRGGQSRRDSPQRPQNNKRRQNNNGDNQRRERWFGVREPWDGARGRKVNKGSADSSFFASGVIKRSVTFQPSSLDIVRHSASDPSAVTVDDHSSQGRARPGDAPQGTARNIIVQCSCFAGLLGSLTGFAALAGTVAFAVTVATTTTTTTTTAAPAGGGGGARAMGHSLPPSDWPSALPSSAWLPGEPWGRAAAGCPAQLLCRALRGLDGRYPTQGLQLRLLSLPASWLLAFLGSTDQMTCVAQFDKYCRVLMTSSQNAREKVCDASILCPC